MTKSKIAFPINFYLNVFLLGIILFLFGILIINSEKIEFASDDKLELLFPFVYLLATYGMKTGNIAGYLAQWIIITVFTIGYITDFAEGEANLGILFIPIQSWELIKNWRNVSLYKNKS